MDAIRYIVHFKGRVQGVGFRYSACRVAGQFEVAGTVRNLVDGRVRLVCEGDQKELDRFVTAVKQRMSGYVTDVQIEPEEATGEFGAPAPGAVRIA